MRFPAERVADVVAFRIDLAPITVGYGFLGSQVPVTLCSSEFPFPLAVSSLAG